MTPDHREVLALSAHPDGQGESPESFLGNHPVAHVVQPIQFAGFALLWNPSDGRYCALDALAPVHTDEPFVHRTEDQFLLATPAVRVDVGIMFAGHQQPRGFQCRNYIVGYFVRVAPSERSESILKN